MADINRDIKQINNTIEDEIGKVKKSSLLNIIFTLKNIALLNN